MQRLARPASPIDSEPKGRRFIFRSSFQPNQNVGSNSVSDYRIDQPLNDYVVTIPVLNIYLVVNIWLYEYRTLGG